MADEACPTYACGRHRAKTTSLLGACMAKAMATGETVLSVLRRPSRSRRSCTLQHSAIVEVNASRTGADDDGDDEDDSGDNTDENGKEEDEDEKDDDEEDAEKDDDSEDDEEDGVCVK